MSLSINELFDCLPQVGKVSWIGLRPARRQAMTVVSRVFASQEVGLQGDRYSGAGRERQVTLFQFEHLPVIASLLGQNKVELPALRRNIAVKGLNLLALKNKRFIVGTALLEYTGLCHPCSRMHEVLGEGGYNAMRGHGGITARIVKSGEIRVNDSVVVTQS